MQLNRQNEARGVDFSVHLTTYIVLLFVALAMGACARNGANENQNGNARRLADQSSSPSPSPSPSPSGTPEFVPADTIIVIRDGSVDMKVNKKDLCADADTSSEPDKKYTCDKIELGSAELRTVNGPVPTPALTPNSKITINGGGDRHVEVQGNRNHVKIKFKKTHYPSCGSQPGAHCGTNHVGTVTIDSFSHACTQAEKCVLTVRKK